MKVEREIYPDRYLQSQRHLTAHESLFVEDYQTEARKRLNNINKLHDHAGDHYCPLVTQNLKKSNTKNSKKGAAESQDTLPNQKGC